MQMYLATAYVFSFQLTLVLVAAFL